MKSIFDPTFHYTNSVSTDLRKTFARIRAELRAKEQVKLEEAAAEEARSVQFWAQRTADEKAKNAATTDKTVTPIKRAKPNSG